MNVSFSKLRCLFSRGKKLYNQNYKGEIIKENEFFSARIPVENTIIFLQVTLLVRLKFKSRQKKFININVLMEI